VDYDNVVAAQVGQRPIYDLFITSCYSSLGFSRASTTTGTGAWFCGSDTGENIVQQTSTAGIARAMVGTPTDDQVVTTRARLTSANGADRWFGIAARYVDESNYYYLTVRSSHSVSLRKLVNGAITELGTAPLTVTPNTWYDLRLDAVGNELRAFVNGAQVLQATDSSHASGQGGVLTYRAAAEYVNYLSWQP
jgi:pectate lyase